MQKLAIVEAGPVAKPSKPKRDRRLPSERGLLETVSQIFAALRQGATLRQRAELHKEMRVAVDSFFAKRLAEK